MDTGLNIQRRKTARDFAQARLKNYRQLYKDTKDACATTINDLAVWYTQRTWAEHAPYLYIDLKDCQRASEAFDKAVNENKKTIKLLSIGALFGSSAIGLAIAPLFTVAQLIALPAFVLHQISGDAHMANHRTMLNSWINGLFTMSQTILGCLGWPAAWAGAALSATLAARDTILSIFCQNAAFGTKLVTSSLITGAGALLTNFFIGLNHFSEKLGWGVTAPLATVKSSLPNDNMRIHRAISYLGAPVSFVFHAFSGSAVAILTDFCNVYIGQLRRTLTEDRPLTDKTGRVLSSKERWKAHLKLLKPYLAPITDDVTPTRNPLTYLIRQLNRVKFPEPEGLTRRELYNFGFIESHIQHFIKEGSFVGENSPFKNYPFVDLVKYISAYTEIPYRDQPYISKPPSKAVEDSMEWKHIQNILYKRYIRERRALSVNDNILLEEEELDSLKQHFNEIDETKLATIFNAQNTYADALRALIKIREESTRKTLADAGLSHLLEEKTPTNKAEALYPKTHQYIIDELTHEELQILSTYSGAALWILPNREILLNNVDAVCPCTYCNLHALQSPIDLEEAFTGKVANGSDVTSKGDPRLMQMDFLTHAMKSANKRQEDILKAGLNFEEQLQKTRAKKTRHEIPPPNITNIISPSLYC